MNFRDEKRKKTEEIEQILKAYLPVQEGKQQGLGGAISGAADSYWGKNKGRSMEGMLVKVTRVLVILFLLISIVLNIGSF